MTTPLRVEVTRIADYRFLIDYGPDFACLLSDEPEPLGRGVGPGPQQLLMSAVANCLSASLTFALGKFKQDPGRLTATATATTGRNNDNHIRIQSIDVVIRLDKAAKDMNHLPRVIQEFEDYCTVSMSVKQGIAIYSSVLDNTGKVLKSVTSTPPSA